MLQAVTEKLEAGPYPIWHDGAKGTSSEFQKLLEPGKPSDFLNLTNPDAVYRVAKAYVDAGCQIIQTNTFNATRPRLSLHKPDITDDEVRAINEAGAQIARKAAGNRAYVAGNIGPSGQLLEPFGSATKKELSAAFKTQTEGLIAGGVDLIHIETMFDIQEVLAAITAVREVSLNIPIMVTMTFTSYREEYGFKTMYGVDPQKLVVLADEQGLLAYGANCGNGLENADRLIRQLRSTNPNALIVAKLNAGKPIRIDGKEVYPDATPENMTLYAHSVHEAGAKIIGACCGSTPELLRAMINASHADKLFSAARPGIPISAHEREQKGALFQSFTSAVNALINGDLRHYRATIHNMRKHVGITGVTTKDISTHLLLALKAQEPEFFDLALERVGKAAFDASSRRKQKPYKKQEKPEIQALYLRGVRSLFRAPQDVLEIARNIARQTKKVHRYPTRLVQKVLKRAEQFKNEDVIRAARRQLGLFALGFIADPEDNFFYVIKLCKQADQALINRNVLGATQLVDHIRVIDPLLASLLRRRIEAIPKQTA